MQGLTFCGVGAYDQYRVVEVKIKHLTSAARTMLLHAQGANRFEPEKFASKSGTVHGGRLPPSLPATYDLRRLQSKGISSCLTEP